jgi:catechol 2,3-dioxygenase-like lactoylglutathione lyase family enzyme
MNVEASLVFYVERLGFTVAWRHEEQGRPVVAQVDRDGCALILASTWAQKAGNGTMFISLNTEQNTREAQAAALDALRAELTTRGATVVDGTWGYRVVAVADPDGNTLLFNYPD